MHCSPYRSTPVDALNFGAALPCQNQPELLRLVSHWYANQLFAEALLVPIGYDGDHSELAPSNT